jgi:hypothetical protein
VSEEKQTFVIRRTFVLPLGLVVLLTLVLLGVCLIQGQPIAKVIILIGLLLPLAVLFIESALRRVDVSAEGVTAHRLFRQRCIRFADVTSLEAVRVRSRVFITLVAGEDSYLILSAEQAGQGAAGRSDHPGDRTIAAETSGPPSRCPDGLVCGHRPGLCSFCAVQWRIMRRLFQLT